MMANNTPRNGAGLSTAFDSTFRPHASRRKQSPIFLALILLTLFLPLVSAVFVDFQDCLERKHLPDKQESPYLRWVPKYVWASFNTTAPSHTLNITVFGNVTGQQDFGQLPDRNNVSYWNNPNATLGKIVDLEPGNSKYTTLFADFKVLTYSAGSLDPMQFCKSMINGTCPIGPVFSNVSSPFILPAFSVSNDFDSTYSFATWVSTLTIVSGNNDKQPLGCISANITPALGSKLSDALTYLPAAVLALVAIATIYAATMSPWGTSNLFRWSSNYGRDEDLLRLVTPGFGDCLQYIQFIVLSGSLSLNYPGFYQPVVSQASWSVLLFNQSLVSHGNGTQSLVDGLYVANGTYGLTRMGQFVGMTKESDMWACMAIFLLVLIAIVVVITQIGFLGRFIYRLLTHTQDGDLTGKNWPFTAGNIIRIVFNFFMLPIICLSLFQLVVAPRSPASVVATAVIMLIIITGSAVWIFWFIFTARPRAHLFDDLPTVLTYGPLYNTYSDDAAPFAFIPVLLTIIRGIAIGAIQPSGIAQIIMLAICEVILILTLHAFKPFQSNTSMNAYHTFFSVVRLTCILLSVAFVPSLDTDEAPKGWIGYSILLLHAIVLVFGFFLNALQTIIEVTARLAGAGADQRGGLVTVFGKRQLSKRNNHGRQRSSLNSNATMLHHDEGKNIQLMDSRSRSMSASSGVLLNGPYDRDSQRASMGFEGFSQGDYSHGGTSPGTPGTTASPFNFLGGASGPSSRRPTMGTMGTPLEPSDPYYRPPRPRKHTMESLGPGTSGRPSLGNADIADAPYTDNADLERGNGGPSRNSGTPAPAYLRMNRDDSDPNLERRNNTDYSVRESDFYYGLRGPALSSQPTRKLKTGPADPMSPVSSATGWFKSLNLLGGRKKEKSKGFEVVRSTRMPPQMMAVEEHDESPEIPNESYRDSPESPPRTRPAPGVASAGVLAGERRRSSDSLSDASRDDFDQGHRISGIAPTLGPIETGGGIELPSRFGSRASRVTQGQKAPSRAPTIPRKNSRRSRSTEAAILPGGRLSTVMDTSAPATPMFPNQQGQHLQPTAGGMPIRLPFGSTEPSPSPERTPGHSAASSLYPNDDLNVPRAVIGGAGERPLSTGYVQHHMTKDSLQSDGYDAGNHLEASAEIVDRSRSMSTQRSGNSRISRQ